MIVFRCVINLLTLFLNWTACSLHFAGFIYVTSWLTLFSSRSFGNIASAGNPVTGEGYIEGGSEKKEETPRRQRVPPGGYSSKLW